MRILGDESTVARIDMADFSINGRSYRLPSGPVAVVCVDGCEEAYLDVALTRGRMPQLAAILEDGWRGVARGALPSFTNVNNAAIVTGAPPEVTGLSGNFFLDPATGEEVMMNSSDFLRCDTILAEAARAGRKVAMVTAKEKLRDLLSPGLFDKGVTGMAFSAEKAAETREATHGIGDVEALAGDTPPIY
ncbi:MAG: alkaline phosphatase family protein, partial [Verrucomicrobiota bacterium]|nr:alkaline phosphatase family protein [Verrucomicrobiota bacterium]